MRNGHHHSGGRFHLFTDDTQQSRIASIEMIDVPRQTLSKIIAKHGTSLCSDARRCEALLRDLCPPYRREINVLIRALEEGVAVELLALRKGQNRQGQMPLEMLLARLVNRLQDHLALTGEAARWAVDSWALALGVVSEAEVEAREKKAAEDQPPATQSPNVPLPSLSNTANDAGAFTKYSGLSSLFIRKFN